MSSPLREHLRPIARRYGPAIVGVLLLQGLLVALYRVRAPSEGTHPHAFHGVPLGGVEQAPDVSFRRLDGALVPLRSFRGRVVLVHFWATWCPPCRRELPALLDLARAHDDGLVFLLVAVRDDPSALRRFFTGTIPREVMLDPTGDAARRFGAATFPDGFLISREGLLKHRLQGPQDWRGEAARGLLREALRSGP
ncbi:MAG: TlpA disulfide reductase family protein [Polyangiales bacterium]